ncbi:translation termination inhibitor protein i.t1.c1 [Penicillium hispanicum]|uniref:translation termination inhibitor protein i.t1.c1 n=1 Tax=Penicillium hispanicum TaxID=1080232 RepID=UPI002541642E|nr:translation termination inhibitor protein i.t1.c1 [Penicillium hispanicum]KAJ5570192.1 translation termination inhibitor protein i.t1.c1 [Penicillium hispanicum]
MTDESSEDDRSVELSSITAIYPEIKIDPTAPFRATLELPVALPSPTRVCFQQPLEVGLPAALTPPVSVDGSKAELEPPTARDVHILSHLPPLSLGIELPDGYPSEKPPIIQLRTHPPWLPASVLSRLTGDCHRLWEECGRDMVVFTYIDHLQQLAETAFGIQDTPGGEVFLMRDLKIALLDFNNKAEREKFEQETFECGVCLEPKKGVNCYRLLRCSHVFCIACLQDFYNTCITEGDVDSVKCLAPDCEKVLNPIPAPSTESQSTPRKKRDRTLGPSELLQIPLGPETVQRYVFLKRKKKIEADKTTVYCPRKWCQGAARSKRHPKPTDPMAEDVDASDEEEGFTFDPLGEESQLPPVAERVAICEDCNYAFCSVCKKGWHGELVRCLPRRQAEQTEEEKATEEYLRLYTSPCPTCNVPCQKRMGCNHMRCFQCDTHFCYLCSAWLNPENPYKHFNELKNGCFNRLWDLEGGDGLNPEGAEALHQIPDALLAFDDDDDPPNAANSSDDEDEDDDRPAWEFDFSDDENEHQRRPPPPAPPPPAPVPPRIRRHAGNADLEARGRNGNGIDAAARAALERQAQARAIAEVRNRQAAERPARRPNVAQGQADAQPAVDWRIGLQHFLDLVRNDREDEWDSDELDDEF